MSWLYQWIRSWSLKSQPDESKTVELTLYSRSDCPLCDVMKSEVTRAGLGPRFRLVVIDIDGDPGLEEAHGRSIPVLAIDGRPAFKGRLTAAELRRKLDRRIGDSLDT